MWTVANVHNLKQWLLLILPATALWHLWKGRKAAKYEGHAMNGEHILLHIQRYVNSLYSSLQQKMDSGGISNECMTYFSLVHHTECRPYTLVTWSPPKAQWFKLNCDDASRGNPGLAGGVEYLGIILDCLLWPFMNLMILRPQWWLKQRPCLRVCNYLYLCALTCTWSWIHWNLFISCMIILIVHEKFTISFKQSWLSF